MLTFEGKPCKSLWYYTTKTCVRAFYVRKFTLCSIYNLIRFVCQSENMWNCFKQMWIVVIPFFGSIKYIEWLLWRYLTCSTCSKEIVLWGFHIECTFMGFNVAPFHRKRLLLFDRKGHLGSERNGGLTDNMETTCRWLMLKIDVARDFKRKGEAFSKYSK